MPGKPFICTSGGGIWRTTTGESQCMPRCDQPVVYKHYPKGAVTPGHFNYYCAAHAKNLLPQSGRLEIVVYV